MVSMVESEKKQSIVLKDRKTLDLDAVFDVVSFEEDHVLLKTALGDLSVEGEGMRMTRLDLEKGLVSLEGRISALFYSEHANRTKGGFWSRLVK
ncbi:MAG: sporulation protein YabP [Clostridia bacterium]|nr:sporulation protein YabP [Clostridia bacterium]